MIYLFCSNPKHIFRTKNFLLLPTWLRIFILLFLVFNLSNTIFKIFKLILRYLYHEPIHIGFSLRRIDDLKLYETITSNIL